MMRKSKKIIRGIPASPGSFYGKTLKIITGNHIILQSLIKPEDVKSEVEKFLRAVANSTDYLKETIKKHSGEIDTDLQDLIEAQLEMLNDPFLIDGVKENISQKLENAPLALFRVIDEISKKFSAMENAYLKERAQDILEIGKLIEDQLISKTDNDAILSKLSEELIIVAQELSPIQILRMDKQKVRAIITEKGGSTGHLAILAKNYQIPAIVGAYGILNSLEAEEYLLIDAYKGIITQNPTQKDINDTLVKEITKPYRPVQKEKAITKDGTKIVVKVNIDTAEDCQAALEMGADGIGLYRSESMILWSNNASPSEDEQFSHYQKLVTSMEEKPVRIRTFDLGADKFILDEKEKNPFLGNRGIRYCLRNTKWFKKQVRAILRASHLGTMEVMLPMISCVSELIDTKKLFEECKEELSKKKIPFGKVKLGIMVETPSAAFSLDAYSHKSSFFSLGTNDLLQYFMAVDRNNSELSNLYNPFNISFLRILKTLTLHANTLKIPMSICGEIASDVSMTELLIGLGFRELSVSMPMVQKIKEIIQNTDVKKAEVLSREVMKLSEKQNYTKILEKLYSKG
jgi:phosphoenolpyruvate-protein phosphotransferase (PTS system enzyme I)